MSDCGCEIEIKGKEERKVLITLLSINLLMFFIEAFFGVLAESNALIADSLDMLADATVYSIGLYAVGKSTLMKVKAAHTSGIFQITLGLMVAIDAVRRLIFGSAPESMLMIAVGILALLANLICLRLISRHREGEVHMRASWVFSKNDVIANLGIISGGGLVHVFDSRYPDIIIGLIISLIVVRGGLHIIQDAKSEGLKQQEKTL
ncbi:MAG: cation transporter [Mariprofundaceae bacterium]|nr:cation transporter [Mariprofundaceae bacterium]